MIHFRPALAPTIATAIMLPVLIGLGVWQVERLHWKEGLLAALDRNMHTKPVSLNEPERKIWWEWETQYLRVTVHGRFDNTNEAYVFQSDTAGNPGYHIITPLKTDDGRVYLIDRGYVPREKLAPSSRAQGQVSSEQTIIGYWRWSEGAGLFTPKPDPSRRIFYVRNVFTIAKAMGVTPAQDAIIDADATPNPGGWPRGGQTIIDIPNNHLSYAFTWFGLAVVLMGIYIAYHIGQGRLGFRR